MYITQRDIHFLFWPLPFKEDCNADGEGMWQFPVRLLCSNSHRQLLLWVAQSWWEAWCSVEGFRWLKIQEGRREVTLPLYSERNMEMSKREEKEKKTTISEGGWHPAFCCPTHVELDHVSNFTVVTVTTCVLLSQYDDLMTQSLD